MPMERWREGDGRMVIHLTDDAGNLEAILTLMRPTKHPVYMAHLMAAQDEIHVRESGPRPYVEPIPFPGRR